MARREAARLGLVRYIATALFVVSIPVLLITTNVRFAANEPRVYDYAIDRYDAASVSGIDEAQLKQANRALIRYFSAEDQRTFRYLVSDDSGRQAPLFTPRETAHLADVKELFGKIFFIQQAALIYALAFTVSVFLWAREAPIRTLALNLLRAAVLTLAVVVSVAVAALIGFGDLWTRFHFLAFTNDLWQLDPARHHLVQMFPRDFWLDITLFIGLITIAEALAIGGLAAAYFWASRGRLATEATPIVHHRPHRVAH